MSQTKKRNIYIQYYKYRGPAMFDLVRFPLATDIHGSCGVTPLLHPSGKQVTTSMGEH